MTTFYVPPPLIPIALFYLICALISLIGNTIMIICFVKEKKFHSPCHYMITLTCAADMFHLCGHFVFNFQLFYGGPGSQELCFWMLLPSCIGLCLSGPLLLSMGIDRLLACQFPVLYRHLVASPYFYLFAQLLFPLTYTSYLTISSFLQRDPDAMVICQVPLAMAGTSFEMFNNYGLIINLSVVLIYLITYSKLRSVSGSSTQLKVIFKSIFYTVVFVILGWVTVTVTNILSIQFVEDIDFRHIMMIYAGIGLNMACASNVFVFYTINSEYRQSIRSLFGLPDSLSNRKISVVQSTTKLHNNNSLKTITAVK